MWITIGMVATAGWAAAYDPRLVLFQGEARSCEDRAVVTIPAVRKGISNQRMRIVQDMASAVALGLAVRLPRALTSRRGCHYKSSCYLDYHEASVSLWSVYDRELTLAALKRIGVCVVKDDIFDDELREDDIGVVAPLQWPIAMSDLAAHSATITAWIAATTTNASASSFALADSRYCCTLLIPDSSAAVALLSEINGAFVAAERTREHATYVLQAYRARLSPRHRRICAAHWRDNDDFVDSEHNLDRAAYGRVMARAIAGLGDCGGALLLLGDVPARRLEGIRVLLAQARCAIDADTRTDDEDVIRYNESCLALVKEHEDGAPPGKSWAPRVYTKQSLIDVRRLNWAAEYGGWDDLLAMVDFELGTRADAFVGSPFSSFSALVAFSRSTDTVVPSRIDVDDRLAGLLGLQFPHDEKAVASDPCASLVLLSPKLGKRLSRQSCVFDAPPPPPPLFAKEVLEDFGSGPRAFATNRDCYRAVLRWVAPYCASLAPRGLVLLLACVVASRPRRAARPLIATLIVGLVATLSIMLACHNTCASSSSSSSSSSPFFRDDKDRDLTLALARRPLPVHALNNARVRLRDPASPYRPTLPPPAPLRVAVVSSNFGAADALSSAPRQRGSSKVSFFLFARNRDFLAALRGWTLVLPTRAAPRQHRAAPSAAIVYSKSWDDAIERIEIGKRKRDHVATGLYSRQLVELPFDLESLEYTTKYGIGPEFEEAQNLVDVMAPKFVKLQMFRIDVLEPYNVLVWADASLVLDTAAVSRALRPLLRHKADLVVQPHPKRNSTLEELKHILEVQNQDRFKPIAPFLRAQRFHYTRVANFSDSSGLFWMAYFGARRNNKTIAFFDRWWLEVRRWQYRDQVSVMYALNSGPPNLRPKVATFEKDADCCKANGRRLPPEQVLCVTLVGDFRRCCRRCRRSIPPKPPAPSPSFSNSNNNNNNNNKPW